MIQLQLQPEIEAQLTADARAHGLALERYVETLLSSCVLDPAYSDEEQAIHQGLADMEAGRTQPLDEVFEELRAKYAIPR
jgi:predicted transcriptional regulator